MDIFHSALFFDYEIMGQCDYGIFFSLSHRLIVSSSHCLCPLSGSSYFAKMFSCSLNIGLSIPKKWSTLWKM